MKVFTNTAVSLDGKINTVEKNPFMLGSEEDKKFMSVLRNRSDAVLVGGNSFRNWPIPLMPNPSHLSEPVRQKPIGNVIVSRTMDLPLNEKYLKEKRICPLVLTSRQADYADFPLEVLIGPAELTPQWIVEQLARRGVQTLLIEAGGDLIFQFLRANLIDEMYLTLCPRVIGGKAAPSLADGTGFLNDEIKRLKILKCRQIADEIFLHYEVLK